MSWVDCRSEKALYVSPLHFVANMVQNGLLPNDWWHLTWNILEKISCVKELIYNQPFVNLENRKGEFAFQFSYQIRQPAVGWWYVHCCVVDFFHCLKGNREEQGYYLWWIRVPIVGSFIGLDFKHVW